MDHRQKNRQAWNTMADGGSLFARTATDAELQEPLKVLDSRGWLPKTVAGLRVLCLGSGGGWQSILYAAAGADVTVVDISESMLRLDVQEARRRGYRLQTVHASMEDLSMLPDVFYDVVHQPVSTCYVPKVSDVYRQVARVMRGGGVYISQHKQPTSLQISHRNRADQFVIGVEYYQDGPLPEVRDTSYREDGTLEYLHRWQDLVGGLCRAGFVLEDLTEPLRADPKAEVTHFGYRGRFVPPYVRLKARRCEQAEDSDAPPSKSAGGLWLPPA